MYNEFLNPVLRVDNLHLAGLRQQILTALREASVHFSGKVLDVGCGRMPYRSLFENNPSVEYIGIDLPGSKYFPELIFNNGNIPLQDNSLGAAFATEVLEHCAEPTKLVAEIYRVLKPGGYFFFTVPFVWPLHGLPDDYWRFTPQSLKNILHDCNFNKVTLKAHSGWDGSLAQMIGLWVTYRGMRPWKRSVLQRLLFPVVATLNKTKDSPVPVHSESLMASGWSGLAQK